MRPEIGIAEGALERLEKRGHSLTSPRKAVLRAVVALMSSNGHFSAEDISRFLPRVGRATVYRTMRLLADEGIVCRVLLEDGNMRYRLSHLGHHHHLLCVSCGSVQDFLDRDLGSMVKRVVRAARFEMGGHWLEIYGRCQKCQEGTA